MADSGISTEGSTPKPTEGITIVAYVLMALGCFLLVVMVFVLIVWFIVTRCGLGRKPKRSHKSPPPYYISERTTKQHPRANGPAPYIRTAVYNRPLTTSQHLVAVDNRNKIYTPAQRKPYASATVQDHRPLTMQDGISVSSGQRIVYGGRSRSMYDGYPLRLVHGENKGRYYVHKPYYRRAGSDVYPATRKSYNPQAVKVVYKSPHAGSRYHGSVVPTRRAAPPVYVLRRKGMGSRPVYLPTTQHAQRSEYGISPRLEEEIRAWRTEEYVRSTVPDRQPDRQPVEKKRPARKAISDGYGTINGSTIVNTDRWATVDRFTIDSPRTMTERIFSTSQPAHMDDRALILQWEPGWSDRSLKHGPKSSSVA